MASDHFDSIMRSGYEAQAHRRHFTAPIAGGLDAITPDESPTFTHPVSPDLDSTYRYTTSPPVRRRTNPWVNRRDSISSESGDGCDQPLTRRLSQKVSRRLSRRASSALSKFNLQRTPTDADEEVTAGSPDEPNSATEPLERRQSVPIERRRSSLQKIRDFIISRRKDSAISDNSLVNTTTSEEDDGAVRGSGRLSARHGIHDVASDVVSFNMTGALPVRLSHFHSLDGIRGASNDQTQVQVSEQMNQSSDESSGREDVSPTTDLPNPFLPKSEDNTNAERVHRSHSMNAGNGDYFHNLKRKRSRGLSSIHIPRLPSVASILHKERSLRSPMGKPKKREPGLISPLGGNVHVGPWIGRTVTTTPLRSPASLDDIGVLPPSSMDSVSHISAPVFATKDSGSSSSAVPTPSSSLPHSEKAPSSPQLDPITTETAPSGGSFTLPSPTVPVPDSRSEQGQHATIRRHKLVFPDSTHSGNPSRSVERPYPDGDCLSIDATISDSASVREELPLSRMGILLHELREAAPFANAVPGGRCPNCSVDATVSSSPSALEDSPLRRMEIVLHELRGAAAFRTRADSIDQSSDDGGVDLDCLAGMEGMEGTLFARRAIEWAERADEGDEI